MHRILGFSSCSLIVFLGAVWLLQQPLAAVAYTRADFPSDFIFGAGSSASQVEGAIFEDGRTPSILDTNIPTGNVDKRPDEYHKYKEDVRLMVDTGLNAYRFSFSWSRLIPNGRGPVNPKGVEYYNNLINELVSHGIEPHVLLLHMDTPQALEDDYGGWVNRYRTDLSAAPLNDTSRVEFLNASIGSLLDGARNGSNVRGYFVWSFLDLFELTGGNKWGFGLYYVDLGDPELKRYPKLSANWYSAFLKRKTNANVISQALLDINISHSI